MEYKILEGTTPDVQKTLNQWRHQYELKIIKVILCQHSVPLQIVIVLTREEK